MIDKLKVMNRKFDNRNMHQEDVNLDDESERLFDLNSANKKYPMSYEIESVISLLKSIQNNIEIIIWVSAKMGIYVFKGSYEYFW